MRAAVVLLLTFLAGCAAGGGSAVTGPPGQPSVTDVNPISGTRGGSGASASK